MASINVLPVEVLIPIAETLDRYSLINFAIVNSTFHQAARAISYKHLQLIDNERDSIREQIPQWLEILSRSGDLRCVRSIGIVPFEQADPPACRPYDLSSRWPDKWRFGAQWSPRDSLILLNQKWAPFATLLRRLSGLRDFSWACSDPVPPCILEVLHRHLPQCRLNVQTFFLHSLLIWPQARIQVSPLERAVATSPNLRELAVCYSHANPWGLVDYHEDSIMDLISGGAPNLRRVSLHVRSARWGSANQSRQEWDSEKHALASPTPSRGMLTHLEICSEENVGSLLLRMSTKTDFTRIRSLRLYSPCQAEDFLWMAEKCRFASLQTLALGMAKGTQEQVAESLLHAAMIEFLRSIPILESLSIPAALDPAIVRAALEQHGQSLRELSFYTSAERFQWQDSLQVTLDFVRANCSVLMALAMPISDEVDRNIGSPFSEILGSLGPIQHMLLFANRGGSRFSGFHERTSVESIFHDIFKAQLKAIPALSTLEFRTPDLAFPWLCRRVSPVCKPLQLKFQQVDWRSSQLQLSDQPRASDVEQGSGKKKALPRSLSIWRRSDGW